MAVSFGELEAIVAKGWRAPEQAPLGGWLLRSAQGFTGRANSCHYRVAPVGGSVSPYFPPAANGHGR